VVVVVDAERIFATRFLYTGLLVGLLALIVLASALLLAPTSPPPAWGALVAGALCLVAAVALARGGRQLLAGGAALVGGLLLLGLLGWLFPLGLLAVLLPGTLLLTFAAVVAGWWAALATALALIVIASLAPWQLGAAAQTPPWPSVALALAAGSLVLQALALGAVWRHAQGGHALARRNDESLDAARSQLDDERAAQRQITATLERERRLNADLIERLTDGVAETDADGLVRRANLSARAIWRRLVGGDIVGQPVATLHERLAAAGERQPLELHSIGTQGGEQQHILIDRSAIERSERLRSELMQLIAVEMRNPLTSMLTALEMTLGEQLPDGTDRVLAGARRSGQRLLETVVALQEISELETNPQALRRTPSPLRPLIEAAIAQATPPAQQSAVNVVVEYNAEGTVDVDGDRLRRSLLYLLDNAIRVSPQYSTVQVQIDRQGNEMQVRVADQGPGIEPEELPLVFHRYVVPREQGKVGALGLTFCRIVVEAHGGRIWVENHESGSSFTFSLPITS
jgi:two-component system, NtrC family, sensor histidine kinase KinB